MPNIIVTIVLVFGIWGLVATLLSIVIYNTIVLASFVLLIPDGDDCYMVPAFSSSPPNSSRMTVSVWFRELEQ